MFKNINRKKLSIYLIGLALITILSVSTILFFTKNNQDKKDAKASYSTKVYKFGLNKKDNSKIQAPFEDINLNNSFKISTDGQSFFAINDTNQVKSFGFNKKGQLGNGQFQTDYQESLQTLSNNFSQVKVNNEVSTGLTTNGEVKTWGGNSCGRLGINLKPQTGIITSDKINEQSKNTPGDTSILTGVKQISAGQSFSLALKNDGNLFSWGCNFSGQLGLGNRTGYQGQIGQEPTKIDNDKPSPTQIPNINNIKSISTGRDFAIVLKNDGTVWSWGNNDKSQLGLGNSTGFKYTFKNNPDDGTGKLDFVDNTKLAPTQISTLKDIVEIAAGPDFAFARDNSGKVFTWGDNTNGKLGLGNKTTPASLTENEINNDVFAPKEITNLTNVKSLGAGEDFVLALQSTGDVYSWGANTNGQLGLGDTNERLTPTKIPSLANIQSISTGGQSSFAVGIGDILPIASDANIRLLTPDAIFFSPDKANLAKFKDKDLTIGVKNDQSILSGATCVFKGKEYPTALNPNPQYIVLGTSVYTNNQATATLPATSQNSQKWDFEIRCTNPVVSGNPNSGLTFGNNPGYALNFGAIGVVTILK